MEPSTKARGWYLAAGLLLALALVASLLLAPDQGGKDREPPVAATRVSERSSAESATGTRLDQTRRALSRDEQRAALDLIERMRGPAMDFPVTRMAKEGEGFPKALLDELAQMNAGQFQTVVLGIARDRTIHGATRTKIVIKMNDAWMASQESPGRQQLGIVLGTIEELLPEFPPGYDVLPVNCVIRIGVRWDPEAMADFLAKHWDRWGGPDSRDGEMLRQSMLRHAADPKAALELLNARR